ncbi:hypothetical protein PIROE2DRAFT_8848 [Piromyces sp. E2]|nr:hypothetical protein PIROE2DRAFT_8848 [Piromyces sp. E2]|eukprot:OUM64376.1 hypothetical protein PIROE2DRAFT_8848 [Piromyces sp. E2]
MSTYVNLYEIPKSITSLETNPFNGCKWLVLSNHCKLWGYFMISALTIIKQFKDTLY